MNKLNLMTLLDGVPNTAQPAVITGRMFHTLVRQIQRGLPMRVVGATSRRTPEGTVHFINARSGGGGDSDHPFKIVRAGNAGGSTRRPIVGVLTGAIAIAINGTVDADQTQVPAAEHTFDGAAHTGYEIWLDIEDEIIVFGPHEVVAPEDIVPHQFRFLQIGEVDVSAESGSGDSFVPSRITEIRQYWSTDFAAMWMPDHKHSETGDGGNALRLLVDDDVEPSLKIGRIAANEEEYIFSYDSGNKRGMKAKYKSAS